MSGDHVGIPISAAETPSTTPAGASEVATPSEKSESEGASPEEGAQLTAQESPVASVGASDVPAPSEKAEVDGAPSDEGVLLTLTPVAPREVAAGTSDSSSNRRRRRSVQGASPEEGTQLMLEGLLGALSGASEVTPSSEKIELKGGSSDEGAKLTAPASSVAPQDASDSATCSEEPDVECASPEKSGQLTTQEISAAPAYASGVATLSEHADVERASREEGAQLAAEESPLAPPGASEVAAACEQSGIGIEGASSEDGTELPAEDAFVASQGASGSVMPSEEPDVEGASPAEGTHLTLQSSVAPQGASSPATPYGKLDTTFALLEADAKIAAKKLQSAGKAHEDAWEELIPILDDIQKHLSLRGEIRDRSNSNGLPTWTEWWQNFRRENDFDACLRRVQKKLKEFRARVRARQEAANQQGESKEQLHYVEIYDKLRVRIVQAKKDRTNPKGVLADFIPRHFFKDEVEEIVLALRSKPAKSSATKSPVLPVPDGRTKAPEAADQATGSGGSGKQV